MTDVSCYRYSSETISEDSLFEHITVNIIDKNSVLNAYNMAKKLTMNFEKFRLESYVNWPVPFISPKTLANNGFYYLGVGDKIKCNFCDLQLHEFNAEDIPSIEHRKFAPYCPFNSNKNAKTANIPLIGFVFGYGYMGSNKSDIEQPTTYSCCCGRNFNKGEYGQYKCTLDRESQISGLSNNFGFKNVISDQLKPLF